MVRLAALLLNNDTTFLPDVTIEVYSEIAVGTTAVLSATVALFELANVDGLIVELPETDTLICGQLAAAYNKPVLSMNSITEAYIERPTAPTLFRMATPNQYQTAAIVHKIIDFGKESVFYLYTPDNFGQLAAAQFANQTKEADISIVSIPISGLQDYTTVLNTIIVNVSPKLNTFVVNVNMELVADLMTFLNSSGYIGNQFLYLLATPVVNLAIAGSATFPLCYGAVGFKPQQLNKGSPVEVAFMDTWNAVDPTEFPGIRPLPVSGIMGYDAVLLYANVINNMLQSGPYPTMPSSDFINNILHAQITGVSGHVQFAANGDREGLYVVLTYLRPPNSVTTAESYNALARNITKVLPFTFFDGSSNVPQNTKAQGCYQLRTSSDGSQTEVQTGVVNPNNPAICDCFAGYSGAHCEVNESVHNNNSMTTGVLVGIIVGAMAAMGVVLFIVLYLYRKRRAELVKDVADRQRSQINKSEIKFAERIGRGASGEVFKANFRGTEVAVKKLVATNTNGAAVEEFMLETAIMCGLRHPNIVLFMGSCFDVIGKEMLLVMEYHSKGSLHDVLRNERINLTLDLQIHIACHAAQGMNFLHESSPPIIHRDLKSHNVLLDEKWNARISDFGITKIKDTNKKGQQKGEAARAQSLGTIFWTAPEVIGGETHTEKSDCYSFGIVLWELFHRQEPYTGKEPMVVALEVLNKRLRPPIGPTTPESIKNLMESCWAQDPDMRPSFATIVERLRGMTMQHPLFNFSSSSTSTSSTEPPTGTIYLIATKIDALYKLFDTNPRAVQDAIKMHNHLVRTQLELFEGYEVKYENFEFLLAFKSLEKAVNWCISFQTASLHVKWPEEILSNSWSGEKIGTGGVVLWKGLRVRTAIHMGTPAFEMDHHTGHMAYFGPVVDKIKLINVSTELEPGIVVSAPVKREIESSHSKLSQALVFDPKEVSVAGVEDALFCANPESLRERTQILAVASSAMLNVPSMQDLESGSFQLAPGNISPKGKANWVVNWTDLDVKENIGKGPVGDYYKAYLNGKEVAVKVLVNQGLKEDDLICLVGDAAIVSKTKHPNLLEFQAVCIDFKHISIITKYIRHGNLRQLLSNNLVQINYQRKVNLAKQIASGMEYLASHPDNALRIFDSLKTNNVLITEEWEAKIADYGQSNVKDLARTMTSIASVVWTAPEILCGEPATPKSAIYSFGIVMWELLSRTVPFETEHPVKVVTKILAGHRPPIPADCPRNYREVMENCWHTDPEMRPSWHVINSDLSHILDSL